MDEKQAQKFHEMTEAPVGRLVCRLAAPCIISMLVTAFYNMADTFFVGMLKNPSATGAVGVVFSLMAIIQHESDRLDDGHHPGRGLLFRPRQRQLHFP